MYTRNYSAFSVPVVVSCLIGISSHTSRGTLRRSTQQRPGGSDLEGEVRASVEKRELLLGKGEFHGGVLDDLEGLQDLGKVTLVL